MSDQFKTDVMFACAIVLDAFCTLIWFAVRITGDLDADHYDRRGCWRIFAPGAAPMLVLHNSSMTGCRIIKCQQVLPARHAPAEAEVAQTGR